ncbi:MAG: glycoside hydrolase family 65 protein [Bacteroidetes bacterium]|uniref:glycoside hydrolase family 65 protein n=1 Tax=Phnomibacter sp. TaxID=2836217 RepID=UPI002FDCD487|nr:glycoside hydrolase family 65 protein [Bacteroidota bacterium]
MCSRKMLIALLMSGVSVLATAQDAWRIAADSIGTGYYGITSGNGMIGIISSSEPFKVNNVVLAGAYDSYGRGRVSNFINSFNLLQADLRIDGRSPNPKEIINYRQQLNARNGGFEVSFQYPGKAEVKYTYYALRHLPYCVLMDVEVKALRNISLGASSILQAPAELRNTQQYFQEIDRSHVGFPLQTSLAQSPTGALQLCATTSFLFEGSKASQPDIIHQTPDDGRHFMRFQTTVDSGKTYRFGIVGASITSAHHPDPRNEAERLTIYARLEGFNRLLNGHNKAWDEIWKSDITIEGDPQSQQDIRNMLYHLYASIRPGTGYSLSPMGLSGQGYNGHVFWDADVWMFPVLALLQPSMAGSMIEYRFQRLPQAKQNALSHGYKGAMYPWESAVSGYEETPVWALSGPFEHHITACVALAAWQYYCVTQDKDWLHEKGWPIIEATAAFWCSRVERNGPGKYDINNVVAADEWAENVDNDAFTNAAAKANLQIATEAASLLGKSADPDWALVAKNIPVLQFENGVTKEHSTYNGGGIKQGDVNLLAFPLKEITQPAQIRKDLEYYETRVPVSGTPAMTQAIFSLLYSRLGDSAKAWHFFQDAYRPNLNPPFRVMAEFKGGTNPYFLTGAGGVLQAVLFGFGGLDITGKGVTQMPSTLPAHWKKLTISGVGKNKQTIIAEQAKSIRK